MDNVEELVEWVARKIVGKPQMVESPTNGQWVPDPMHEFDVDGAKDLAKQILSHPDLFIKVACQTCKGGTLVNYNYAACPDCINGYNVIPLAEAL